MYPIQASDRTLGYVRASTTFEVLPIENVDAEEIASLKEAKRYVFDLLVWYAIDPGASIGTSNIAPVEVESYLESVLDNLTGPPHLEEFIRFLRAVYADIDYQYGNGSKETADNLYADFLNRYPESVYEQEAWFGLGAAVYSRETLAAIDQTEPPGNGSCLQIPAEADITFATTSVWGTGYNAEITLINTGTETIRGWQLSFDQAPDVTNLWNGQLTSQGTRRTVTNAGHNGVIAPGASTTFGLQVQNSSVVEPTGYSFNPDQCADGGPSVDIAFATTSVWGTGYNAEITLTNTGSEAIRGWQLSFDQVPDVTNLWNGQLTSDGSRRTVTDAGHNGVIAPGQSVTFGFQVQSGSVVEPSDYEFAFWTLGPPQ